MKEKEREIIHGSNIDQVYLLLIEMFTIQAYSYLILLFWFALYHMSSNLLLLINCWQSYNQLCIKNFKEKVKTILKYALNFLKKMLLLFPQNWYKSQAPVGMGIGDSYLNHNCYLASSDLLKAFWIFIAMRFFRQMFSSFQFPSVSVYLLEAGYLIVLKLEQHWNLKGGLWTSVRNPSK